MLTLPRKGTSPPVPLQHLRAPSYFLVCGGKVPRTGSSLETGELSVEVPVLLHVLALRTGGSVRKQGVNGKHRLLRESSFPVLLSTAEGLVFLSV